MLPRRRRTKQSQQNRQSQDQQVSYPTSTTTTTTTTTTTATAIPALATTTTTTLVTTTTTTTTVKSNSTPAVLCIHEILELILSFLSQHALRNMTSLVSRQWYKASRRHILVEALWASNFQPEKRLDAMNRFLSCQVLTLTPDAPERRSLPYNTWPNASHAQRQLAWREVLIQLQKSSTEKEMDKVKVLNLKGFLDVRVFCRVVEQYLAPQLVVLQLETFKPGDYFYLERILKGCPRLEVLKVEPQSDYVHGQAIPGSSPEDPGSEHDLVKEATSVMRERQNVEPLDWNENLKLKTLVLFQPAISQRVIQAILSSCPDMRVLRLISVIERAPFPDPIISDSSNSSSTTTNSNSANTTANNATTTTANNTTATTTISATAPENWTIQPLAMAPNIQPTFSFHDNSSRPVGALKPFILDEFITSVAKSCKRLHTFHLSLSSRKIPPETVKAMLERMPTVRHWGFVMRDITTPSILPMLREKAAESSRLTTLEIRCAGFNDPDRSTSMISKALHEFLCTTPTLLHLIAPMITYYTEYLDLKRILVGSKDSHPDTPRADGRFWACRNLKTLHLEIRARFESDTLQHSRVIFGYLSKVTPRLEDLELRRPYLSFYLHGGLCLLSRLHNLERLKLSCRNYTLFQESDVMEWIKRDGNPWGRVSSNKVFVSSSFTEGARLGCRMAMIRAGLVAPPNSCHLIWYNSGLSTTEATVRAAIASATTIAGLNNRTSTSLACGGCSDSTAATTTASASTCTCSPSSFAGPDTTYPELTLADFDHLGDMKDIEDLQIERMLLYQRQQPCWPRLESFTIAYDGWFNNSATAAMGIERLRPDVQFRFETQSFHQSGYR